MRVLSLDTTSRRGSAALVIDGELVAVEAGPAHRTHGERLPGELVALLTGHGLAVRDIDLFAVAAGPGSFTGLRVGIATVQGLALVTGRPVVSVSALDALARTVRPQAGGALIGAWIDAQRGEVFAALYGTGARSGSPLDPTLGLATHAAASVGRPEAILECWRDPVGGARVLFAGSGADVYRHTILSAGFGMSAEILDAVPVLAPAIAEIAIVRAADGGGARPHAIVPIYVRRPDAELAREREKP